MCCGLDSQYLTVGSSGQVCVKNDVADFGDLKESWSGLRLPRWKEEVGLSPLSPPEKQMGQ